jgi:hypothetical protein
MRQPQNQRLAVHKEFRVNRIRVARRDAVPHVRKPALVRFASQLGSHLERAHESAHRAAIGQNWE